MDKPTWLTDELSQEWISLSNSSEKLQQPSKHSSLRVASQCRIPVPKRFSSASSFASLLQQNQSNSASSIQHPRIPSLVYQQDKSQIIQSTSSSSIKVSSDNSIVVNSQQTSEKTTPPWLRAAVDGMVNELLGKRPNQLQKIFQTSQSAQLIPTEPPAQADIGESDLNEPRSDPKSLRDTVPLETEKPSGRDSIESIQSISFDKSLPLIPSVPFEFSVSRSSSHCQDLRSDPSCQSIIDYQEQQEPEQERLEQELLYDQQPMLIPPGCNMERLRFIRDERLNEIIEETEPSTSVQTGCKNTNSQASVSNYVSYPSSSRPPSLPFAHRTPVFDVHHPFHRINSDSSQGRNPENRPQELPSNLPQNQSDDNSDFSTGPRRFRFTFDTFTRKHLNKLTEEIRGLSRNSACPLEGGALLKIKSILGSPGEEVTDSSTSIGLAHSTPPAIVFSSATNKQRTFHAGRTPYRPFTSHSERWKDEKEWANSFVEPSSYAVASLSPVDRRKSYQGPPVSHPESETSEGFKDSVNSVGQAARESCRSSKRIRLDSTQSDLETRHRHLRDSVNVMNERETKRRPAAFTRAHPMVVFKSSVSVSAASGAPHEKSRAGPVVVRDRLAEAKVLMDRIRAKASGGQEVGLSDPPTPQKSSGEQLGGSSRHTARACNSTSSQNVDLKASEYTSALADGRQQPAESGDCWEASDRDPSPKPSRHTQHHQAYDDADDPAQQQYHQVAHCPRNDSEADLNWDISIEERAQDVRDVEQEQSNQVEIREGCQGNQEITSKHQKQLGSSGQLDSVHRRLATTAAAFLRQTLGDSNVNHQTAMEKPIERYGSSSALTSSSLGSTAASRRQFATQAVSREPIGRVTHDERDLFAKSNRISSVSTAACTTTSAPTPALTTGTTTRHSSSGSHSLRQGLDGGPRHPHHQKLGLMTIAPADVEELLQNARVGKMVFDSTIGKWVKVRSQSETGALNGKTAEEEHHSFSTLGHPGSQNEESSEEDDIFKDIESLQSKRESESSGSRMMAGEINDTTQTTEVPGIIQDQQRDRKQISQHEAQGNQGITRNPSDKKRLTGRTEQFQPKSVLKTGNETPNKNNASMTSSTMDDSHIANGISKSSRSESHQRQRREGAKEDFKMAKKLIQGEEKENRRSGDGSSDSENEGDNTSLHQTSKILMNSIKKKVRRKSSLSSTPTASRSNSSLATPQSKTLRANSTHNTNLSMTTTTNSNNLIEDYSFELNYSKLIKIITDFEPFEPFWNSIKVINLASKSIDSVIRLNEILPALDQIDLSSNQLNYLSGLPSSLRMLIAHKNQINELCCFSHLPNLERLDLSQNSLTSLEQLSCLKHLRELKVNDNLISDVSGLYSVDSLKKLSMKGNRIKKINFELAHWDHLEVLNLDRNQISEVTGLHHLKSVYLLNLDRNQLYTLTIEEPMPKLRVFRMNENRLESLEVSKLVNLRTLYIDTNDLMEISGASRLRKLENLSVRDQRGGELSLTLKQVRDVKRIYLGGNPLPAAFPTCQFYNLLYLELAMCQCQSLPADLASLIPNIRTLNLNYNFLKDLSPLKNLRRLERLTVVGSRVKMLDRGLLNVLESLPELELLDLRQNPLCSAFYPPLLLSSTPSSAVASGSPRRDEDALAVTPHLNQYQIVTKDQSDDWHSMDDRFRKSLPNEFYLKRMTYRALVLKTCDHSPTEHPQRDRQDGHHQKLKWLDGIRITDLERRKLEKFLRGISRKLDPNREHQNSSQSVDLLGGSQSSRHHLAKNTHDQAINPVYPKQRSLRTPRQPDQQSSDSTASRRSRHQAQEDSTSLSVIERSRY
ncbi:hypothetical protein VP01_240g3 [Puccinia sorghi]|uniref:Adenylate cyclase n=1 Tax=Puccinia sorghi TaxID=27349 RepID=A0A0L6V6S7_9BASI|nr:hypothetical protein VP01_240g3 [Puccinia sorghi]